MPVEPTEDPSGDEHVFEAFARLGDSTRPLHHVGSVRSVDPVLAWQAARDQFTRRDVCIDLWVVPRRSIIRSSESDAEVLSASDRRAYRQAVFPSAHRRVNQSETGAEADS